MKKVLIVLALALLIPIGASADPIYVGDWVNISDPGSRFSNGGPFKITKGSYSFLTFCIELGETFNWGNYQVKRIDTVAIAGGTGGNPDPLSYETAYLYTQFRGLTAVEQTLQGAAYQQAIWYLEQEYATDNDLVTAAQTAVSTGAWTGLGDVRVLGYDLGPNGGVQDMLVLVPEPGSMLLLGTGLVGLAGAIRRRLRK